MKPEADYLFEASWEVCNKVGGIYTVVKSKASVMKDHYSNYFLIGPYIKGKSDNCVEWKNPPDFLKKAFEELNNSGIKCHYGSWLIEGEPNVMLLEYDSVLKNVNDIKKWMWENYQVDSIRARWDFHDPLAWSWAVGILLDKIDEYLGKMKVVLHCHEWLAGAGLLYLRKHNPDVRTVFTTHATMLGRSIAGSGMNLYDLLDNINPDEQAYKLKVEEKHSMEKACAHNANAFTTVSEITGLEAEKLLGKKPDVLLNNGLESEKFPTFEENTLMHIRNRDKVREFIAYFFFPHYVFEMEHNIIFFIVGRYEFKNKGIDILVESLKMLNETMKQNNDKRTITMFFWIPMSHTGLRKDLVENKTYYYHIKNTLELHHDKIMNNLLHDLISQKCSMEESLFTSTYVETLKKQLKQFKRSGNPPVTTHEIPDQDKNPLISSLLHAGLDNNENNPVKVIVYPVYLDGNDDLLNLSYYNAISASHLGIFPSYYEPWGYTPLESMSLSVPAVTTDLAGFGRFIKPHIMKEKPGIFVLDRWNKSHEEEVSGLFEIMLKFTCYNHPERVQNKINAKTTSFLTDWKSFVNNYIEAHNKALE